MVNSGSRYLRILGHHKFFALGLFVIIVGVVAGVTMTLPKFYKVSSDIYIVPKPVTVTDGAYRAADYDYRMLNNQMEIIRSDKVAKHAAKMLEAQVAAGELSDTLKPSKGWLQGSLAIGQKNMNASVLSIDFTSQGKPADLPKVLNAYLSAYKDVLKDINSGKAKHESEFLKDQLEKAEDVLADLAIKFRDFQANNKTYNIDTQINQLIVKHERLDDKSKDIDAHIASMSRSISASKAHLPSSPEYLNLMARLDRDPETANLRKQIVNLEGEKAEWSSKITTSHPKMKAYNEELAKLKDLLNTRLAVFGETFKGKLPNAGNLETASSLDFTIANDIINNQIKLQSLQAQRAVVDRSMAEIGQHLTNIPEKQLEYAELKVRFDIAQERVKLLQKRLDEASLMEEVSSQFTTIDVLKEPQTPGAPVRPNFSKNIVAACLLGMCFSLFAVFVRSAMDNTLRWSFQLNGILRNPDKDDEVDTVVFDMPAAPTKRQFDGMLERTNFSVPEHYKRVIIHLENLAKRDNVKRIGVVPVSDDAESNTMTVALSLYLTELSNKMVLIDTDFSRYSATQLIANNIPGIAKGPGLTEYLEGDTEDFVDVIYPLGKTVYGSFIPSGNGSSDGFQFSNKNLGQLESVLSPNYNFVMYAMPAVEKSFDAIAVSRSLDGVLLTVKPGQTSIDQVANTIHELRSVGCRILGVLFEGAS